MFVPRLSKQAPSDFCASRLARNFRSKLWVLHWRIKKENHNVKDETQSGHTVPNVSLRIRRTWANDGGQVNGRLDFSFCRGARFLLVWRKAKVWTAQYAGTRCPDRLKTSYPDRPQQWNQDNRSRGDAAMKNSLDAITQQIRVLLADDHPVVRQGLATILRSQKDIKIVAEATDGEETCALYEQLSPDVLILDLRMPKKDGLQVVAELVARRESKPQIIVMTAYETEADIRQALKAGAKAFLVKAAHPQQIREAVRRVAKGESFLPPEIGFKLAESMSHPELSNREIQVLQYLGCGKKNKEIGQILYIGEDTVKHHVKSILRKLDAIGRSEAMAIATRRGLIRVSEG
jgi:two-component system, NarL family, response regulator